jgi:hypothetical protein
MAHPDRVAWVGALQQTLGPVPVAWAAPPYATEDDRGPVWRTCREALLSHGDQPFHCVLQDDAVLGEDFLARVEELTGLGDNVYMLFWRPKRSYPDELEMAREASRTGGDHFVKLGGSLLGVGVVYPTKLIPDIVAFADAMDPLWSDDDRVKTWVRARGVRTVVPIPSLVDHRDGASLVGHDIPGRRAWRFR